MTPQDALEAYLVRLRSSLRGLTVAEREDICEEIRTHVWERVGSGLTIAATLEKLGSAEELACAYSNGALVLRARSSLSPWIILRAAYRWAMTGVHGVAVFMTAMFGYVFGLAFMLCALLKPIFPEQTGFWVGPGTFNFGFRPGNIADSREVLGPWFVQVSLLLGVLFFVGTTMAMRRLLSKFRNWRLSGVRQGEAVQVSQGACGEAPVGANASGTASMR
jgi:hypothetical protein